MAGVAQGMAGVDQGRVNVAQGMTVVTGSVPPVGTEMGSARVVRWANPVIARRRQKARRLHLLCRHPLNR